MNTGVYCILNTANGKRYIGSAAKSLTARWDQHRRALRRGAHKNIHLQAAWNKYGEECFVFFVVARCSPDQCVRVEQLFINALRVAVRGIGYNIHPLASSPLGVKRSAETRAKVAAAKRGKPLSAEHREKVRLAGIGRVRSPEAIEKTAAANRGKKHTPEFRARLSVLAKARPPWTAEQRVAAAVRRLGRKHSQQTKDRIGAAHRGKKLPAHQVEFMRGRPRTAEARRNMSIAVRARHAAKRAEKAGFVS